MRASNWFLLLLMIGFLILSGCASPTPALQQSTNTVSFESAITPPTVTPEVISTPLPTFPYNPTPVPTETYSEELQMIALLQAKDCTLPCYLGITPGTTSLSQAETILKSIGAYYIGDFVRKDGSRDYGYLLKVQDSSGINETLKSSDSALVISVVIDLITISNTIQDIEIDAGTAKGSVYEKFSTSAMAKFREYWSRYTAREIFLQMGVPDHLYIENTDPFPDASVYGRRLLIVYDKHHNAAIQLYGSGQENNICPENEARFIEMNARLYNPNSALSVYTDGRVPPTGDSAWLPIEKVLGLNNQEFYRRVISDPSTCFKPKVTNP